MRTTSLLVLWAAVVSGCAASPPPAAAPPGAPPRAARAEPHAPETPGMALPGDADKVPAAPAECQAFATRSAPAAACDEKNALGLLAAALAKADAAERDTALTALEPCTQLPLNRQTSPARSTTSTARSAGGSMTRATVRRCWPAEVEVKANGATPRCVPGMTASPPFSGVQSVSARNAMTKHGSTGTRAASWCQP